MTRKTLGAIAGITLAVGLFQAASTAQQAGGAPPYTVVESGRGYARLQDAVDAIGSGSGTIRFAALRFADCAVQTEGSVTYQAAVPGQSVLDGTTCEGKAALVLRGRSAKVDGLVFANMRVPDKNGAGIRLEHGNLAVSQTWFRDSEQGILSAADPDGTITVDKSTFSRLGTCEGGGGCAHSIYIGDYGALTVTRSRFEAGRGGHYVKSRAERVGIFNSSFDDAAGRGTNYMIDLPAGAVGEIKGNWFVQGRNKENHSAFIAVGAEDRLHSSNGLKVVDNDARMAPGVEWRSVFVADWSGDNIDLGTNRLGEGLQRFEKR